MYHLLGRINSDKAEQADVDLLGEVAQQVVGKCLCPLGDFATSAVFSGIELFQNDFNLHVPAAVNGSDNPNNNK
jgi:NADH-quinone oxidoreductase subunit F